MTDFLKQIAFNEGCQAYADKVSIIDCPYRGVSETLADLWEEGWWEMFYDF